jgi:TPR repeat protein
MTIVSDSSNKKLSNASEYIDRGREHRNNGDFNKAIADFNEAIRLDPNNEDAYCGRGKVYEKIGDINKALADYNEAIRLNPNYVGAYSFRGGVYEKKGDLDNAIADYTMATRYPNDAVPYWNRGNVYRKKGDTDKAIADYTTAIRIDPNYWAAYYGRSSTYEDMGDYERAIADSTKAIQIAPTRADGYYLRGTISYDKGNVDNAIADYTEAIRLRPDAGGYYLRGATYNKKGDLDKAIADYTESIRLEPKYAYQYGSRGIAYGDKGDFDKAIADFTEAIRLNPNDARVYEYRGRSHTELGHVQEAICDLERSLELSPNNENATAVRELIRELRQSRGNEAEIGKYDGGVKLKETAKNNELRTGKTTINDNPTAAKEQYELGEKYNIGKGVPKDQKKAYFWFSKAAEQDHAQALRRLSFYYLSGLGGVPKDKKKASDCEARCVEQLTKEAEQGSAAAMSDLGDVYHIPAIDSRKSDDLAIRWYVKAVEKFKVAAKQGDADAQFGVYGALSDLDRIYACNYVTKPEIEKEAQYWLAKAAENGHAEAQFCFGLTYSYDNGIVPKDTKLAVYWLTKSAEQGNVEARYHLGMCYYNGDGVPRDVEKAKHLITLAAEDGHEDAKKALEEHKELRASKITVTPVDNNPTDANEQYALGSKYLFGWQGLPKNAEKAVYWFTKAAEQGNVDAMSRLGIRYELGDGVLRDMEKANYWYAKVAEHHDTVAIWALGVRYYYGNSVPKDVEKSRYWIALAAERGLEGAQMALKRLNAGEPPVPPAVVSSLVGSHKNWLILLLLSIFLGLFGVDRFYVGKWVTGILKLLTIGGFYCWWILDVIWIASGRFTDANGVVIKK